MSTNEIFLIAAFPKTQPVASDVDESGVRTEHSNGTFSAGDLISVYSVATSVGEALDKLQAAVNAQKILIGATGRIYTDAPSEDADDAQELMFCILRVMPGLGHKLVQFGEADEFISVDSYASVATT